MGEVYLAAAARTAIGTFGGALKSKTAIDLGAAVIKEVKLRAGIQEDAIDEVMIGNVFKSGIKGNPGRQAAIHAGLPVTIPAITVDMQCASGLRAITMAYDQILAGESGAVIAGGTESMTNVPHLVLNARWGQKMGDLKTVDGLLHDGLNCAIEGYHMGITAENLAEKYNISREEQDEFALNSQMKANAAIQSGKFEEEIVQIAIKDRKIEKMFFQDEHPKETSIEKLQALRSAFKENGTVTAGNASGINDGAAAVLVVSERKMKELGLKPLARIRAVASAAVQPSIMGIGPVPATVKALKKANMSVSDLDLVELNEAFAAQVLAVNKELNIPESKINVNGGAIALGHPVGCSGARIVVTLIHELRRQGKSIGLASLCVGGGQGVSIIIEAV